ncbi:trimethylamine methyltransferase family protein [Billgrantia sp. Q4P2]|uniref:trimethylamine methyltransferase family protein n=1 Tax=Billgrantia sp. Q4P2 TaxID=3463857 RepID=UPI004056748A
MPHFEVLDDAGLSLLEEIGIDFRDDEGARQIWRDAGGRSAGERVRIPRGLCRRLIQDSVPRQFIQHARNPARNVEIVGPHTVYVPAYGTLRPPWASRGRSSTWPA